MYCQQCFQTFGLCLSQLSASVQYLLHSAEFAAVLLWMLGPWGHPHSAVYLISACIVPPGAHVVFAVLQHGILVLEDSSSRCFLPSTLIAGFLLQGLFLFICNIYSSIYLFMFSSTEPSGSSVLRGGLAQEAYSWIVGWVDQLGVLAPQGVTVVAAPAWAPWALSLHL